MRQKVVKFLMSFLLVLYEGTNVPISKMIEIVYADKIIIRPFGMGLLDYVDNNGPYQTRRHKFYFRLPFAADPAASIC
jgi:hypothetical protein